MSWCKLIYHKISIRPIVNTQIKSWPDFLLNVVFSLLDTIILEIFWHSQQYWNLYGCQHNVMGICLEHIFYRDPKFTAAHKTLYLDFWCDFRQIQLREWISHKSCHHCLSQCPVPVPGLDALQVLASHVAQREDSETSGYFGFNGVPLLHLVIVSDGQTSQKFHFYSEL